MRIISASIFSLLVGILILILGAFPIRASENSQTITLDRAIHFLSTDGSDVLVPPGTYTVEQAEEWVRLIAGERHNAYLLEAEPSLHEEKIQEPLALAVLGEEGESSDVQMVMLLLPGGKALIATGSLGGIRDRGLAGKSVRISPSFKSGLNSAKLQFKSSLSINPNLSKLVFPFQLVGLWHVDPWSMKPYIAKPSDGKWFWPGAYDLYPKLVHLTWLSQSLPAEDITKIVAKEGYGMELRLNGSLLQQGPNALSGDFYAGPVTMEVSPFNCPQGKTCLATTILRAPWKKANPPWTVELTFWKKVKISDAGGKTPPQKLKAVAVIHPNQTNDQSYFTEKIFPIFQHYRCTTCHSLGSKEALIQRHNGILTASGIAEKPTALGVNLTCGGGCHQAIVNVVPGTTFHETEWKAPHFSMGIDWRNKTSSDICQKVTSNLSNQEALKNHFHEDARIAWAVHSGVLPMGKGTLPVAPPGDFHQFLKIIDPWIFVDFPCPE